MIFHLPVLSFLGNVSDRYSWLPKKTPKPFSPCQSLTPSQQTWCVAQSEWHILFAVPSEKGLWPPQANLWVAGAGEGAPRGGGDSEKIKHKFWSRPSDSPGCSLLAEGAYSDVFFLLIPTGECLRQNRHSNDHTALKGFKYFETANGFYLQNTPPLGVEGDIHFTTQRKNQGLPHWEFGYRLEAKVRSLKVLVFHCSRTHYPHVSPGQQGGVQLLLLYARFWRGVNS